MLGAGTPVAMHVIVIGAVSLIVIDDDSITAVALTREKKINFLS